MRLKYKIKCKECGKKITVYNGRHSGGASTESPFNDCCRNKAEKWVDKWIDKKRT